MDKLKQVIEILFNRYRDKNLTKDEEVAINPLAKALLCEYSWYTVFQEVQTYLITNADLPEKAVKAAHIFSGT